MHRSQVARAAADPAALEKIEEEYRRDRERITYDRDKKIEAHPQRQVGGAVLPSAAR